MASLAVWLLSRAPGPVHHEGEAFDDGPVNLEKALDKAYEGKSLTEVRDTPVSALAR
jgi:hypothetical protein